DRSPRRTARRARRPRRHRPPRHRLLHPGAGPGRDRSAGGVRDLGPPGQQPGHRLQRAAHPGHHPGHLRLPARAGVRRAALPRPRHPRAVRAGVGLGARGARRQRRDRPRRRPRRLHPHPGGVARDPAGQPRQAVGARRRDRRDALAQPAAGRRLQVQPAERGTGRHRRHLLGRRGGQPLHRGRARRRPAGAVHAGAGRCHGVRLPRHLRRGPAERARPRRGARRRGADRGGPARRGQRPLLGRDRRAAPARPHRRQPAGRRHVAVHDARLGRQDPDGLLLAERDGLADPPQGRVRRRDRQRRRRRPARHRDPRRRADEPQPLPRGRDLLPVRRRAAGLAGRCRDRQDARLLLDDRPGRRGARPPPARGAGRVQVVRPGPAVRGGRLRRRGVRRGVVPAPGRIGVEHRQGRPPAGAARLGDHRADGVVALGALRPAGRAARRPGVRPGGRPRQPRAEGEARRAVARRRGGHRARRRADHRQADRGARQRRRHRRAQGDDRERLVRRPAVGDRGRLQDLRRVVPRTRPPRGGAGRGQGARHRHPRL
ncbi:MAG: Phosphoglucomutase, partial [uncultured Nocardioidaceae bacterium]